MPNLVPRIFWCAAYVHIPKRQRCNIDPKLDHRAGKCIFIGYAELQNGYRCYDPITNALHITLELSFFESESYYSEGASPSSLQGERGYEGISSCSTIDCNIFEELENLEEQFGIRMPNMSGILESKEQRSGIP